MEKTKQTILVCIDSHPKSNILLHIAANKAAELKCPLKVLYIESSKHYKLEKKSRELILQHLTNAEKLGAEIHQVQGENIAQTIFEFIKSAENISDPIKHLVIGKRNKEGFFAELKKSTSSSISKKLKNEDIEIQTVPLSMQNYTQSWFERFYIKDISLKGIFFSLFAVFTAYILSESIQFFVPDMEWLINVHNITAFFLIACVITSLKFGLIPSLIASLLSFSIMNYYYVPPLYNFGIDSTSDGISLSIFLFSAVVVSLMGGFSRANTKVLIKKERRSQALYHLHRISSEARDKEEIFDILHKELLELLEMNVVFYSANSFNSTHLQLEYPKDIKLNKIDYEHLKKCWSSIKTTGFGADRNPKTRWRFEPMVTTTGAIGVIGFEIPSTIKLDASFGRLVAAIADQTASILQSIELSKMMNETQIQAEREKLRSMLLSSVSHDLKTPLASIIGSLSVYNRMLKSNRLSEEDAKELIETALEEAQRLDGFISNILDMTKIESGEIEFDKEWVDVYEPVKNAAKRLNQKLSSHIFVNKIPEKKYTVQMDLMMTEQVLQNVIDNAVKYSAKGGEIEIYAETDKGFSYVVKDNGDGIPEEKLNSVFDKYERLKHTDSTIAGTGLGLAICKAVMLKQGGDISARNGKNGGAEFVISFPRKRDN